MSSFSSDAAPFADVLTRRLAAALAASVALHAMIAAGLAPLYGPASGGARPAPSASLRVTLRNLENPPPAEGGTPAAAPLASGIGKTASASPATPGVGETASASPPPVLRSPRYFRTLELDAPPGIMARVEPEYPEAAARRMLSGKVKIRLLIDESGYVERVEILQADPPGYFESSVQKAFGAARFSPGMKDGRAVRVQLLLEVEFDSPGLTR